QKDPGAALGAIATACKVKADGAPFTGKQDSTATSQTFDLKGAKGQCYRVAATTGAGVKGLVVTLMDAEGAIAAEYHTDDIATADSGVRSTVPRRRGLESDRPLGRRSERQARQDRHSRRGARSRLQSKRCNADVRRRQGRRRLHRREAHRGLRRAFELAAGDL